MPDTLLQLTPGGLYCAAGDFYIDPWGEVERAVITHAHRDHARPGAKSYLCSRNCEPLLRLRLGDGEYQSVEYGEPVRLNGVQLSLHPAGHVLGSAQVRVEHRGEVWVVTGDYKRQADASCEPYEPQRCDTLVTESTFGLPAFRWPDPQDEIQKIESWWRGNQEAGKASVLYGYSLGKTQRLLAHLDSTLGPIYTHGAVERVCAVYRGLGVAIPETQLAVNQPRSTDWSQSLIVAPPSAHGTPWLRRFGNLSTGLASGWMRIRGIRRRRAIDRGFVVSDHVDWDSLNQTIVESEAERVWVTHGYARSVVRWLQHQGRDAQVVETRFVGETLDETPEPDAETESPGTRSKEARSKEEGDEEARKGGAP